MTTIAKNDLEALVRREHPEPHSILGAHASDGGGVVVRALRPSAESVSVKPGRGKSVPMTEIHPGGIFEAEIEGAELPLTYKLKVDYGSAASSRIQDPYAFLPTIGELDLHLMGEGRHEELYERLGAHVGRARRRPGDRVRGVGTGGPRGERRRRLQLLGRPPARRCARWAPAGSGSCSSPTSARAQRYKYEILTQDGEILLKADPYAQETEVPPKTASVIHTPGHAWSKKDAKFL